MLAAYFIVLVFLDRIKFLALMVSVDQTMDHNVGIAKMVYLTKQKLQLKLVKVRMKITFIAVEL